MVNVVRGSTSRRGARSGLDRVWLAAIATVVFGGISALLAFWPSTHVVASLLGLLSLPLGGYAQMFSTHTNQRWAAICGATAGGFGLALGIAHGGFFGSP